MLTLKTVFPNLLVLFLDATHLAMNYEKSRRGKGSLGSRALRRVLAKFGALGENAWGTPAFTGEGAVPLSATEAKLRSAIAGKGAHCSAKAAQDFLDGLGCDTPFSSREEFIRALACVAVVHAGEMKRRGHKGRSVGALLASAVEPAKCAWYFNNHVHRHAIKASRVGLLPSGTTSNEALHAELKQAFRQHVRVHQATLATKMEIFSLGKLMTHTLAAYRPTTRQMPPSHVRARALAQDAFTEEAWRRLCERRRGRRALRKAVTRLHLWRCVNTDRVRAWLRKRPAAECKRQPKKRTVFSLQRGTSAPERVGGAL